MLTDSLTTGYSGAFFGDDSRYYNRVDFSGVEHFVIRTGNGHDGISTGDGNDTVSGGDGNDTVLTAGGNDVLMGGAGKDVLDGGAGIDTADYGDKTVAVAVTLNGSTNASVTVGGVAEDTIRNIENVTGGSGNDVLKGDSLANRLEGGAGNDMLRGGAGADTFVFGTALQDAGADAILDFAAGIDRIALDDAFFIAFSGSIAVSSSAFHIGGAAHDADDRLIYDSTSGTLLYDADGNGTGISNAFAVLSVGLSLTERDFLIV